MAVSGPTPGVRTFPSAVAVPDGMLIYGGFNDQSGHALKQTAYNDVWHMAINGNTGVWQNLEPAGSKPGAGSHSQAAVLCGVGLIVTIGTSTHKLNWPTGCPPGYAWQAGHCLQCPAGFESPGGCNLCQASEPSESVLANLSTPSLEISFLDEEVRLKLQVPQVPSAANLTWNFQLSASKELQVLGPCLGWAESESETNLSTTYQAFEAFAPFQELQACLNSTNSTNSTNATVSDATTTTTPPRDTNVLVQDAFLAVYLGSESETLAEWVIPVTLQACPSGYKSVAVGCLPSLAHALPRLPSPSFQTSLPESSMLRLSFEADLPTVAENISLGFRARLGSDEGQTDCKAWNQTGQGRFVLELSVAELDDCKLNVSTMADYVAWSGVATLALLGDFYDKPVALWIFPVTFRFDRLMHAFSSLEAAGHREVVAEEEVIYAGALNTTLALYESDFTAPKQQAVYFVWERAFVELGLGPVSVVANVDLVWLAASSDASAPIVTTSDLTAAWDFCGQERHARNASKVHNLTDSMIYLAASPSSRRFSVQLEARGHEQG